VTLRRVPAYLRRAQADSLVRNSLYLMASTVVTGGLGYVFWALAAHEFTSQDVGVASAVISLCSTAALLTYLGSSAILIERLPSREGSARWTYTLARVSIATAAVTGLAAAVAVPVLKTSPDYRLFFSAALPVVVAVIGAAAWTLVNLFGAAFIAARRAGRLLAIQSAVSIVKIAFIVPLAAAGAAGIVEAWVASALLGVAFGVVWLVPRMRLGRPSHNPRRRVADTTELRPSQYRNPRHKRAAVPPNAGSVRHLLGQHLTSVGGAVTPLVLPVLVVLRLGATQNAYFFITWMLGLAFFMVSPSVATAVFAEGVRSNSDLPTVVIKALRVIAILLSPAIALMVLGGRHILDLFGAPYAASGYTLLVLLAASSVPDAVSNVAVAVFRVTGRLAYSSALNLGILVVTLSGAWVLMPRFGIAAVGAAWLGAQSLGAAACLPAYMHIREAARSKAGARYESELTTIGPHSDVGIALLIDLAHVQSLDRLSGRVQ
jgi:O-antigen/teichoic acid export membrane protein